MNLLKLPPATPTRIPGTNIEIRWDGHETITVHRTDDGIWDLSPLTHPGRVLAYQRLADHPHIGWWPLLPLTRRTTYHTR